MSPGHRENSGLILIFFEDTPPEIKDFQKDLTLGEVSQSSLLRQGYGVASDWRKSLEFLSQLIIEGNEIAIGPPQNSVIDSFFRHITRGKKPNLAHKMISVLADSGQIQLLLTINFDELLETSMLEAQLPLTKIPLNRHATLPPRDSFWPELTLIKMHGDRYDLRADYSLDIEPSPAEIDQFTKYFLSRGKPKFVAADLFIAGTSLDDKRLKKFVESLVNPDKLEDEPPYIFWTYYSEGDRDMALKLCKKWEKKLKRDSSPITPRIWLHQTKDVGLLLLHHYQRLNASLPNWGVVLPDASNVPWPPSLALTVLPDDPPENISKKAFASRGEKHKNQLKDAANRLIGNLKDVTNDSEQQLSKVIKSIERQLENFVNKSDEESADDISKELSKKCDYILNNIKDKVRESEEEQIGYKNGIDYIDNLLGKFGKALRKSDDSKRPGFIAILGEDRYQSLTETAATLFEELETHFQTCIWIDLDNSASVDELFEQMRSAFATKACLDDWTPGLVGTNGDDRAAELVRYMRLVPGRWNLFLNAREQPGINAPCVRNIGKIDLPKEGHPNGWLDLDDSGKETSDSWDAFARLMEGILGADKTLPLTVILIGTAKAKNKKTHLYKKLQERHNSDDQVVTIGEQNKKVRRWVSELIPNTTTKAGPDGIQPKFLSFNQSEVINRIKDWIKKENLPWTQLKKWRFLIAMTLMKRARHRAALYGHAFRISFFEKQYFSIAFNGSEDVETTPDIIDDWIEELEYCGLIRKKPGGFIWLHSKTRDTLNNKLPKVLSRILNSIDKNEIYGIEVGDITKFSSGCCHVAIASWYRRVLYSSSDSFAAIDALVHYCQATQEMSEILKLVDRRDKVEKDFYKFILNFICDSLQKAQELLQSARSDLVSRGTSGGKCRRLEEVIFLHLRTTIENIALSFQEQSINETKKIDSQYIAVINSVFLFRHSLFETMSMIAREIGENVSSFKRLRQYAESVYQERFYEEYLISKDPNTLIRRHFQELENIKSGEDSKFDDSSYSEHRKVLLGDLDDAE